MKKFLAMLLCLTLVLTAMALVSCKKDDGVGDDEEINLAAGSVDLYYETGNEYGDKFEYEIVNGLEIAIIGFSGSHQPHAITVPSIIDEREVTTIAVGAFYQRSNISSVTLPDTVTTIEDMAFAGCAALASVTLSAATTELGEGVFSGCTALTAVTLPAGVTEIPARAFFACTALETVAAPGVVEIGEQAFMNCAKLTAVSGMTALAKVEGFAFFGDGLLTGIDFANVTAIGEYAFTNCYALGKPTLGETVTVGTNAFYLDSSAN